MCGISGELRFDGRMASVSAVERMAERMVSRGPDDAGSFQSGPLAFAQRRLKIIDLSQRSSQPMVDPELGLALVYNGAIYNYQELRQDLEGRGYRFFSDGDTEVILKGFHLWGRDVVEKLQGMFAFAIWERQSGKLTLARDRLGIKPLYLSTREGQHLRFASSLPALLAAGDVDTAIDPVALHNYMSFHSVVPSPRTILKGVRKLSPATVLEVERDGRTREHRYWEPSFGPQDGDEQRSEQDWKALVLDTMRTAVKRRLVADVDVGVLLSGGLDSSLIVGLLAEAGQRGLTTFSVGFEPVGGEAGDEFQYSDIVAERFGTRHHKIFVDTSRTLSRLPDCIRSMNEPMVSHDNIGFFLLAEEVSKHVKVVQSGQGADEVFGGYHWYPPLLESDDAVEDYAHVFFDRDHEEMKRTLAPNLVGEDLSRAFLREHFGRPGATRAVDKALRLDTHVMLVDDPVKRVDSQTMAWSLEARVPFLDHEVVELACRVPAELKVGHGGKHILKEAARDVIPREVIDRPKGYFPVPALKYLRGPYLDMVRDTLTGPTATSRGLFQRDIVESWLQRPDEHITPLRGSKLWQAALLELWLQTHGL